MAEDYTPVPLSALRRAIATRMTEATQTIPHFRIAMEAQMDALLARQQKACETGCRVSINDCIVKACAWALMRHPALNVQLVGEELRQFVHADISVVVAVEGGLLTPVVRQAERKSVWTIGEEIRELAARARAGRLRMSEISGGSFSVSNLGAHGVDRFDAIINPPQCAILAVGRVREAVLPALDGNLRVAHVMTATLSADHRVLDGVAAAAFMRTWCERLAEPREIFE